VCGIHRSFIMVDVGRSDTAEPRDVGPGDDLLKVAFGPADEPDMSVMFFTGAQLVVLCTMLGGLLRKRAHDRSGRLAHARVLAGRPRI
jgi:hypothetical protein